MRSAWLLSSSLAVGCAAPANEAPPRVLPVPAPLAAAPLEDGALAPAPSRTLLRRETVLVGAAAPKPAPARPPARKRVSLSLFRADLENALRFLADAGRFNLVVEAGLAGSVTTTLRDVDAFDALVTIAGVNGAVVAYEHGIVTVRKAR